jgi:hypothetical protein
MPKVPPDTLICLIHENLSSLLTRNPAATSSEAYVRYDMEMAVIDQKCDPHYYLRIGINYRGATVQQLKTDDRGVLIGWNPGGDALGTGRNAKVLLAGTTIVPRDSGEQIMSDTKIGGGDIPKGSYIRIEFKARGWLGQTKNLAGKELEKDLDHLINDRADLLIICLSETVHRKWRGEGSEYQAKRRTGTTRFVQILMPVDQIIDKQIHRRKIKFEGQEWTVSTQRVIGSSTSMMPGAEHFITLCWRRS